MRLLTGKDILDFHASGRDYLVLRPDGAFAYVDHAEMDTSMSRCLAYDFDSTKDGRDVQMLLDVLDLGEGGKFDDFLDDSGAPEPAAAERTAAYVNEDGILRMRIKWVRELEDEYVRARDLANAIARDREQVIAMIGMFAGAASVAAERLSIDEAVVAQFMERAAKATEPPSILWPPVRDLADWSY